MASWAAYLRPFLHDQGFGRDRPWVVGLQAAGREERRVHQGSVQYGGRASRNDIFHGAVRRRCGAYSGHLKPVLLLNNEQPGDGSFSRPSHSLPRFCYWTFWSFAKPWHLCSFHKMSRIERRRFDDCFLCIEKVIGSIPIRSTNMPFNTRRLQKLPLTQLDSVEGPEGS